MLALLVALLLAPISVAAQQAKKPHRIGMIFVAIDRPCEPLFVPKALAGVGYKLDIDYRIEARCYKSQDQLDAVATELVAMNVDLIVTATGAAVLAARKATSTIPIVAIYAPDLVAAGLAETMHRPGGNVTGVNSMAIHLYPKRIQLMRELLPELKMLAVLLTRSERDVRISGDDTLYQMAAAQIGNLTTKFYDVREPDSLPDIFATMRQDGAGAVLLIDSVFNARHRARIIELAATNRMPAMYPISQRVEIGGLISYGPSVSHITSLAASQIVKVFQGQKPAEIPIVEPTETELSINLKAATALAIEIPPALLARADRLID